MAQDPLAMLPGMTPAERATVRHAREADQAERDARADAHSAAHPLTAEDREQAERVLGPIRSAFSR